MTGSDADVLAIEWSGYPNWGCAAIAGKVRQESDVNRHSGTFSSLAAAALVAVITASCAGSTPAADDDADAAGSTGAAPQDSAASGPVTIGVMLPFSGQAAFLGENIGTKGAELAVAVANANGGVLGEQVTLVTQDTERRPQAAISALRALQSADVTAAIGPTSSTIPAVLDDIKGSKVPWIPIAGSTTLDSGLGDTNVWRTYPSDTQASAAMLLEAARAGGRVGMVFENNAAGQSAIDSLKQLADGVEGITIVEDLLLAPEQPSYNSEASRFFEQEYDIILWQLFDATASGFFKSASQVGALQGQYFLGTDGTMDDTMLELLGPYLGEGDFAAVTPAQAGPGAEEFRSLYAERYDEEKPGFGADHGYDMATLLMLAIEQAQSRNPDAIASAVTEVAMAPGETCVTFASCTELIRSGVDVDYDGAANGLELNSEHNVVAPQALVQIAPDGTTSDVSEIAFDVDEIAQVVSPNS